MKVKAKKPKVEVKPEIKRIPGAPAVCPHCDSPDLGSVYIQMIDKTMVGCRACKKYRLALPGRV